MLKKCKGKKDRNNSTLIVYVDYWAVPNCKMGRDPYEDTCLKCGKCGRKFSKLGTLLN